MDQAHIQQLLNDGIQAVQRGDRVQGRQLLLQVVAADEASEPAWLWLSRTVDDPADQLVALENVLTLNPENPAARESAQALRERLGLALPPAVPPAPPPPQATAAPQSQAAPDDDLLDRDPDQCVYCGKITEAEASTCPFCHRSLLQAGFWEGNSAYRWLIVVIALALQAAIIQPGLALMLIVMRGGDVPAFVSGAPFLLLALRICLWVTAFLLVLVSQNRAPATGAAVSLIDSVALGVGFALGWMEGRAALISGALDFGLLALATSALVERSQARLRQRTVLDRNIYDHIEFHRRGSLYARQGKWALAALHFQRAMALGPRIAVYYKDLSAAQVRLGRYRQAAHTLQMGADMHPDDAEFSTRLGALNTLGEKPNPLRPRPQ